MRPHTDRLTRLIRLHAVRAEGVVGDAELVRRFVELRDEGAFEELLRRYGPMVHSVCSRELPSATDVEDAFQTTFLALVRDARVLRNREAVGGWLYRAASRTAIQITRRDRRRTAREIIAARVEEAPPLSAEPGDDVARILDRELAEMPARYREPLVLCRVRGLTMSAAGEELGLSAAGVCKRVQRGEKLLRDRLASRGVAAPVAGVTVLVCSLRASAGLEKRLCALVRTATAQEYSKAAALWKPMVVFALGSGAVFAAVLALSSAPQEPLTRPEPVSSQKVASDQTPPAGFSRYAGDVLDADGKPVANVRVVAQVPTSAAAGLTEKYVTVFETSTNAEGTFGITLAEVLWAEKDRLRLAVTGQKGQTGYLPLLPPGEDPVRRFTIRLHPRSDAEVVVRTLSGKVTTRNGGNPVANALVEVDVGGEVRAARTDATGAYALEVPAANSLPVRVTPPSPVPLLGYFDHLPPDAHGVANGNVSLAAGRVHTGRVVDQVSRRPVVGAEVRFVPEEVPWNGTAFAPTVLTDAKGAYAIAVPVEAGTVSVLASEQYRRLVRDASRPDVIPTEGTALLTVQQPERPELPDIELVRAAPIRGSVRLADGTPVPAGSLWCAQKFGSTAGRSTTPIPVTDGRFVLPACTPGETYDVAAVTHHGRYAGTATVRVADRDCEIVLKPMKSD